jgi:hypothetical protein
VKQTLEFLFFLHYWILDFSLKLKCQNHETGRKPFLVCIASCCIASANNPSPVNIHKTFQFVIVVVVVVVVVAAVECNHWFGNAFSHLKNGKKYLDFVRHPVF